MKGTFKKIIIDRLTSNQERFTQRECIDLKKVESLNISVIGASVQICIHVHDKPCIDIVLETYTEGPLLKVKHDESLVDIAVKGLNRHNYSFLNSRKSCLLLSIPSDIAEDWNITTESGDVEIEKIEARSLFISSRSGDVTLLDNYLKEADLKTSSGDLVIKDLSTGILRFQTSSGGTKLARVKGNQVTGLVSSGKIRMSELYTDDIELRATSGGISLEDIVTDTAELECSSGSIKTSSFKSNKTIVKATSGTIKLGTIETSEIEVNLTSGNIMLHFENKPINTRFDVNVSSGHIKTDLPMNLLTQSNHQLEGIIGQGENSVKLAATSGSIILKSV